MAAEEVRLEDAVQALTAQIGERERIIEALMERVHAERAIMGGLARALKRLRELEAER